MDLSIIIVNYNTCKLTLDAIHSIYQSNMNYQYEVIVVDNASSDNSVEQIKKFFPQVKLIQNNNNLGFSKANNQGIQISLGKYILLLNSDTIVHADTLSIMLEFMEDNRKVGASGCKVQLPNGELDRACRRSFPTPSTSFYYMSGLAKLFPKSPVFNRYHMGYMDPNEEASIDCLVGAFMLVRRSVIDQVGLLDEEYFMYGEDIDWCYRIKEAKWDIYYYPKTSIIHYKGASSRKKPMKIIYEFHRAMFLFHKKHYKKKYPFFVNWFIYSGISVKFTLSILKNRLNFNG